MSEAKVTPIIKGRDVAAPVQHVTYKGQSYPMIYNNLAARIAEDIYEEKFGRDIGYYGILDELAKPKHRAIMAIVYASLKAGGVDVDWNEFEETFSLADIEGMLDRIRNGIIQSLPDEDPDADPEDEKNGETTPTVE